MERPADSAFPATAGFDFESGLRAAAYGLAGSRQKTIVIGIEGPMSGPQKDTGIDMWRATRLAAREINQGGGILGMKVKLIKADDKADPERALKVARRLEKKGAVAVVGPFNSGVGLVNLPYYVDKEIIPTHLTSSDLTEGYGITVQPKESQIGPVEVGYMLAQGVRKVSILVDPSAFTVGMADRVQAGLLANGVQVQRFSIDPAAADYSAVLTQVLASNPDMVYVSTYYPEGSQIARSLVASGNPAKPFMGLANVDPAFVAEAGLDGAQACVFSGEPAAPQLPTATQFVTSFERRYNRAPGVWGVWGVWAYDSLQMLDATIERTGSTDDDQVLGALLQTRDYQGQTGSITIDPLTGNRVNVPVYIMTVDANGVFVVT